MDDEHGTVQQQFGMGFAAGGAMMMTREQQMDAGIGECAKREDRTPGQFDPGLPVRGGDGVVRHDDFPLVCGQMGEDVADMRHLVQRDPPILPGEAPRRVEPEHHHFLIGIDAVLHAGRGDMPVEFGEGFEEPPAHIIERHIVIAGHHQRRPGNAIEEMPRLGEFRIPCALGEIAADRDRSGRYSARL
jgi:hypothetical protein